MRSHLRWACLAVLLAVALARPTANAAQRTPVDDSQNLPPISYVCPMAGDEDVLEGEPGACPKCRMSLVPVRLDSKYSCPVHSTQEVKNGPGTCRFDGRQLLPVTLSVFWMCADNDKRLLEPGTCANGTPRRIGYEVRAHGDHNPRHGGQFFMAQDGWHHVEAALQPSKVLRLFFYDNFTKPLMAKSFSARLVTNEQWDPIARIAREVEVLPMKPASDPSALETPVKGVSLPLKVAIKVKFGSRSPEQRFDFQFSEYSVDPATSVSSPAGSARSTRVQSTTASVSAAPSATTSGPSTGPPASPPLDQNRPSSQERDPQQVILTSSPPPTLQELDESVLPSSVPALLAELTRRLSEVEQMVTNANLADVWLPSMATKTVALAIDTHSSALPERQRTLVASAVKRVVLAAWELDAYGDLGNKEDIVDAYNRLASAVSDLKAANGVP